MDEAFSLVTGKGWLRGIPEFRKAGCDRLPPGNLYDLVVSTFFFRKSHLDQPAALEVKVLLVCRETTISIGSCEKKTLGFSHCGYVELKFGFLQKLTKMNRWWLGYPLWVVTRLWGTFPRWVLSERWTGTEKNQHWRFHHELTSSPSDWKRAMFVSQANFWDPLW